MEVISIVIVIFLIIAIGLLAYLNYDIHQRNEKSKQSNIIYPFNGRLAPSGIFTSSISSQNVGTGSTPQNGLSLMKMADKNGKADPQIQCPVGTKVNIIGAWVEVTDPYGECSNVNTNELLKASCGNTTNLASSVTCKADSECPPGMMCGENDKCISKTCSVTADCGGEDVRLCSPNLGMTCSVSDECGADGVCVGGICEQNPSKGPCISCRDGKCVNMPLCSNATEDGLNPTCSPAYGDTYRCRPRDASAYLARWCDGKQECLGLNDPWKPNVKNGAFGPLPCNIPAESTNPIYATLPVIPGNYVPDGESLYTQGYYVHGIYTCIPDE